MDDKDCVSTPKSELNRSSYQSNAMGYALGANNILSSPLKTVPSNMLEKNAQDFAKLSNQLTALLNQLSDIYTEIGYSKNDIQKNEVCLFEAVSATFEKFHNDSVTFRDALIDANNKSVLTLKRILNIINDPTGTRTIPDLYIRNLITKNDNEGSTLLGMRKNLDSSKKYIMKEYRSRLLKYLESCRVLNELKLMVDNFESEPRIQIPNMSEIVFLEKKFKEVEDGIDAYEMVLAHPELLLDNSKLTDLSDRTFTLLSESITSYKNESISRQEKLRSLASKIISRWNEMGIDFKSDYSMIYERIISYSREDSSTHQEITSLIITQMEELVEKLDNLEQERFNLKNELAEECENLWLKLRQDENSIKVFKTSNASLSIQCINAYEQELARLQKLKKEFIKDFIWDARAKIEELWDLLCYSDQQKSEFTPYNSDVFDDETLKKHEAEITLLTEKYDMIKPLMALVQQFKALMSDKRNLEESSKDSSRLLVRNSHKILMEEEKMRKRLARQMPKVISELRGKLKDFELQNEHPSQYLGQELLEELDEQQRILESKGMRGFSAASTAGSRVSTRPASAVPSRASSRAPSAVPSRVSSRAPSRAPSRTTSRVPSRVTSPTKPLPSSTSSSGIPRNSTHGIQKPSSSFRRPLMRTAKPALTSSTSCNLPSLRSPTKNTTLSITADMIKERKPSLKTPSRIARCHSSFQPQLTKLPEVTLGSPRLSPKRSPLKPSLSGNLSPLRTKAKDNVVTSPLKSLSREVEDKENENTIAKTNSSEIEEEEDTDVGNDTYSNWREEQLRKLNKAKSVDWAMDTF